LPNHVKIDQLISLMCAKEYGEKIRSHSFTNKFLSKYSNQLSGGERRLIEILLILYSNNKFLLLDEPFKGVNPIHRETIKLLIKEQLHNKGIIITNHDFITVIELSDNLIVLNNGAIKPIKHLSELALYGFRF